MKYVIMIILAILWGILSAEIVDPPVSMIIAFIGGALIGWYVPQFYDKLTNNY